MSQIFRKLLYHKIIDSKVPSAGSLENNLMIKVSDYLLLIYKLLYIQFVFLIKIKLPQERKFK